MLEREHIIPKPITRLNRIPQYFPRKLIIEMMKRKTEQPHDLLSLHALHIPQQRLSRWRIRSINPLLDITEVLASLRRSSPCCEMRLQVRQHELDFILTLRAKFVIELAFYI